MLDPALLINRELSWLNFDRRVLEEANDPRNPLLERCNFLGITASNLDEFYMVRVAGLKQQIAANYTHPDPAGLTPKEQLKQVAISAHELNEQQYACGRELIRLLEGEGIEIASCRDLTGTQRDYVKDFYKKQVFPVLTPIALDPELAAALSFRPPVVRGGAASDQEGKPGEAGPRAAQGGDGTGAQQSGSVGSRAQRQRRPCAVRHAGGRH